MKRVIATLLFFILISNNQALHAQPEHIFSQPGWEYKSTAPFYASPLIQDGIVYIGGCDSIFRAINLADGTLVWEFKTGGEIRSTALIAEHQIFFISGDGKLYCLDGNGKMKWSFSMEKEKQYDFADYHQSSPVLFGNTLYFGSGDSYVYAILPENGALKWKYKTGNVVHSTPAIDSTGLYIGSFDGNMYALNTEEGTLKWKFKTVGHNYFPVGEVQGNPSISDDIVIVGTRDYNVYALDKEKGYCHWNKAFMRGWVLSNTIHDSALYMAGADERVLARLVPENGAEYWHRNMEFLMFGKPAFNGSFMYIGTTIGRLHCINIATGEEVWSYSTDGYYKNRLNYFKKDDTYRDDIYSIILSNEQFLKVEEELGGIFSTPAISENRLVFSSTQGAVICLIIGKINSD